MSGRFDEREKKMQVKKEKEKKSDEKRSISSERMYSKCTPLLFSRELKAHKDKEKDGRERDSELLELLVMWRGKNGTWSSRKSA